MIAVVNDDGLMKVGCRFDEIQFQQHKSGVEEVERHLGQQPAGRNISVTLSMGRVGNLVVIPGKKRRQED